VPFDKATLADFRLKRLQRAVEYTLLTAIHLFFLLAFQSYYSVWMAIMLAVAVFGLNFQLTQYRERRRIAAPDSRQRILADTFESILFLFFVALISSGGLFGRWLDVGEQEYLGYVAATLGGLFLAGLVGEIYWQRRHFRELDEQGLQNYIANLRRTIILPYTTLRRRL